MLKKIFFKKISSILGLFLVCGFSLTLGAILLRVAFSAFTQPTKSPNDANQELGFLTSLIGKSTDGIAGVDALFKGQKKVYDEEQAIKGAGFSGTTDSLEKIRDKLDTIGGGNSFECGMTATQHTGNLGGRSGADAICVSNFGAGWKFATWEKWSGRAPGLVESIDGWVDRSDDSLVCKDLNGNAWESGSSAESAMMVNWSSSYWLRVGQTCDHTIRIACCSW